ncbi:MAG TPA: DUF92 domain-containing protein [Anaerolineales bacterium]|nr:DUF92 domain-containing protein [Anaerolineales bacterium]
MQLILGFLLAALISALAYRARALSASGAWAATLTGGLVFGLGGLSWAVLLLIFFLSSSGLSRAFQRRKADLSEKFSKGSRRDHGQVLANGGLGALLAIVHALNPELAWPWVAFVGSMAAVNADTWATELGVLSPAPPRLITTGHVTERGASGGVTLYGYAAALGGALLVGLGALVFSRETSSWLGPAGGLTSASLLAPASLIVAAVIGGLVGSTVDSLLGATIQAIYYCPACQKETERHPAHWCGETTSLLRGWRWLDNDWVNFACALAGAAAGLAVLAPLVR